MVDRYSSIRPFIDLLQNIIKNLTNNNEDDVQQHAKMGLLVHEKSNQVSVSYKQFVEGKKTMRKDLESRGKNPYQAIFQYFQIEWLGNRSDLTLYFPLHLSQLVKDSVEWNSAIIAKVTASSRGQYIEKETYSESYLRYTVSRIIFIIIHVLSISSDTIRRNT
jgi:hypothetical protein